MEWLDILVTYDVAVGIDDGAARLRKVAKICKNYGQRVQYSVFECSLNKTQLVVLQNKLTEAIDAKVDSVRIYHLMGGREKCFWSKGKDAYQDFDEPLVF